jgi:hypothetical protein
MILSVSRRTDIPRYYSNWFINRIEEGVVYTKNPINPSQISKVILTPENIDCIVFWTKDPGNILEKLKVLNERGYPYYFQFTLTPYGKDIERNLRSKEDLITTFRKLSDFIGRECVIWRYDPIIMNDVLDINYHKYQFEKLCQKLYRYTDICIISFVDTYRKISKWVFEDIIREITTEQMKELAASLAIIGSKYGIEIRACSEPMDFKDYGIQPSACIDRELIQRVSGHTFEIKKDRNQRIGCGCVKSIDIGIYNTCKNGCIYCYANHSDTSIEKNFMKHNPMSPILIGTIEE